MIGEVINNYEVKSLLGEGGMGAVYLAEHPFMGRKAAIKVLRREFAEDRGLVERFMNEARAANAIRHPNIIDIIDVGRMPSGIPYLMMEFLDGVSLAKRIEQRGKMPYREALEIAVQTTAALAAAHAKGIVHRDLKPDNLYLIPDDMRPGGERVKVLDFGIAKLRGDLAAGTSKTQTGSLMGTPPYMSPEQCRGVTDEIDHRTDIYALGIILYEMLCGAPPFMSVGWGEIVLAHLTQAPPPPRSKNPLIPEVVEAVILKALAKTRDERFGSMAEMQAALRITNSLIASAEANLAETRVASPERFSHAAPRATTTTFQGATGEVTPAKTQMLAQVPGDDDALVVVPRRKGRLAIAIGGGAVALAAVIAVVLSSGHKPVARAPEATGESSPMARVEPRPTPTPTPTPVARTAPASPSPPAPPAAAPPAVAPVAQVRVRLDSEPAGATVTDIKKGTILGSTPFEQRLERGSVALDLRIAKAGFSASDLAVPLDGDFEKTVRLERPRHAAKRNDGPVKGRTGAAAPATASAPIKATASAPTVPAKARAVEKW